MKALLPIFTLSSLFSLTACLDFGSDDDESGGTKYYGYFLDSGVTGLNYTPNDGSNLTEGNGRFYYTPGTSTTFSILGLDLGSASLDSENPVVTPATLLGEGSRSRAQMETLLDGDSATSQSIKNQLVLLQTLDFDQDPSNGISLPVPIDTGTDFLPDPNALSDLDLSLNSSAFSTALNTKLTQLQNDGVVFASSSPISEEDAVNHFLDTLENLESLADYEGRWDMRSGSQGDVSAVYTFNSNLSIDLIEYDSCPSNLYGASEKTLKSHCTPVNISQTFSTNGTQLILENNNLSDTCLTLSANSHEIFASCEFQGSGLGSEIVRLQRAPLEFNDTALFSQYTELQAGSSTLTTFNFNSSNNTGSYSSTDETGNITWSFIENGAALRFTTDFDDSTHQFNYLGHVKGSWLSNLGNSSTVSNILRNTENSSNASLLKQSGFFGVFDITPGSATEGQCKEVRFGDSNANQITFSTYANASGQSYACDYPSNWDELTPSKIETFVVSSAHLESTASSDDRRCYLLGIDEYELSNLYVACEKSGNHSVFDIELWRGL